MSDLTSWSTGLKDLDDDNNNMLEKPMSRRSFTEGNGNIAKIPAQRRSRSNTHSASFLKDFKELSSRSFDFYWEKP